MADLTSLARVKRYIHIGVSDSTKDTFLGELITAANAIIKQFLGRDPNSTLYTEYYDGDDSHKLVLRKWPVISVTSIHVDDTRAWDSAYLADSTGYYVDQEVGTVEFFTPASSVTGPQWFSCGIKNIKVVYTAGWATIPEELAQAATELVAWMFNRSGTEGFNSASLGAKSESYSDEFIPMHIRFKLEIWKERNV